MAKRLGQEKLNGVNWTCDFKGPKDITVGTVFQLLCNGPVVDLNFNNLNFILPIEDKYKIKLLGANQSKEGLGEFLVTSYKTGEYENEILILTDGVNTVRLGPMSWTVQSVLDPKTESKMFPPYAPLTLEYPFWLWVILVASFLVPIIIGLKSYKYRRQRRKIREELEKKNQSQSPFHVLHKEFRKLDRQIFHKEILLDQYVAELNRLLRCYIIHELTLPIDDWKTGDILFEIKRNHMSFFKKEGIKIKRMFNEIERALNSQTPLTNKDIEQMKGMCFLRAEEIFHFSNKR